MCVRASVRVRISMGGHKRDERDKQVRDRWDLGVSALGENCRNVCESHAAHRIAP